MKQKWKPIIVICAVIWPNFYIPLELNTYNNDSKLFEILSKSANYLINYQTEDGAFIPPDMNMTASNTYVFLHSYIFDALLDIQNTSFEIDTEIIIKAQNYLLTSRFEDCWNFTINIPTDTDDSAIAAIALCRSGISKEIMRNTFKKLNSTLTIEGYSKFWISQNDTVFIYFVENNSYSNYTGNVYDSIYLTAGTIYSMYLFDYTTYKTEIDKSIALLENQQSPNGSWPCKYWYLGDFYGTFLSSRLISLAKPNSPTLSNAYKFLTTAQKSDGGWGRNISSNPLDTSLALIALYYLNQIGFDCIDSISKGIYYLRMNQYNNGTFQEVTLWTSYPNVYYQGKSLTTLFAVKALALYLTIQQDNKLDVIRVLIIIICSIIVCIFGLYWFFIRKIKKKSMTI